MATDTIPALLDRGADMHGERIAIAIPGGAALSHRRLHDEIARRATALAAATIHGAGAAPRIAIVMPNAAEMSLVLLAATAVGAAIPLNPAYRHDEYAAYFAQANVTHVVTAPAVAHAAVAAARQLGLPVIDPAAIAAATERTDVRPPGPAADATAVVLLTSGSTGRSKLVPLTHRNLMASAADVCRSVGLSPADRCLSMWEQYHIGGVVDLLLAPLAAGGTVISAGGFHALRFTELLTRERPTWFQVVPATLHEVCRHAGQGGFDLGASSLRFIRCVAAALPATLRTEAERLFSVPVIETFGMTEASPLITSTRLPPHPRKAGSVGAPCGPEVRIMDGNGGDMPRGRPGEVMIRGPNVFAGYEGDPEANATAFHGDWFRTGDVGYLDDDGDLFLTGRTKELINRGGEKIPPREIDDALLAHPDVIEAAACGIPHATLGEEVVAAVVLRPGATATPAEIMGFVAQRLADFKVPKRVAVVPQLPRTSTGKVRRADVAAVIEAQGPYVDGGAPTNGLERMLHGLWCDELDVDRLGIDDDFALAGGDSLSRVRIGLATAAAVGVPIPDDVTAAFTTIRSLAAALRRLGVPAEPPFRPAAATDLATAASGPTERDHLMAAVNAVTLGRNRMSPGLLYECRSTFAFEVARHAAENISTPRQLQRMLDPGPLPRVWERLALAARPRTCAAIKTLRAELRHNVQQVVAAADRPELWQRHDLGDHVDLFSARGAEPAGTTLIVGFASRSMRLTTPTYNILCRLSPDRHALLLLRDPTREFFRHGVPGIGDTLAEVIGWLRRHVADRGYGKVCTLGASAGAIPAVCAAVAAGWPRAVACGTDSPSRHPHLLAALHRSLADAANAADTDITLAYSGGNARDTAGARELASLIPTARLLPDDRFTGHALLHFLHLAGDLATFLNQHLL